MSIILNTPIVHTTQIKKQMLQTIFMDVPAQALHLYITNYETEDGTEPYNAEDVVIPYAAIQDPELSLALAKFSMAIHKYALAKGYMKPGITAADVITPTEISDEN